MQHWVLLLVVVINKWQLLPLAVLSGPGENNQFNN
jgi:hypothetical protein